MMRLYLIRHGEVQTDTQKIVLGQTDLDLTPYGVTQMERVAEKLSGRPISAVYSSDLLRARRGGEIIARRVSRPVVIRSSLREKHFGSWEGLTLEEVAARYPAQWAIWLTHPVDSLPEGGESYRQMAGRVFVELQRILTSHPEGEVVIVSHAGVNRVILCHALGLDFDLLFRFEQSYACVNILNLLPGAGPDAPFFGRKAVVALINGEVGQW